MRKSITVSDMSGEEIADPKDGATVTYNFGDGRKGSRQADLTAAEAEEHANRMNARQVARRGRRPAGVTA